MNLKLVKLYENRRLLTVVLAGAFLWSLASINWRAPLVHSGGPSAFLDFLSGLFPPELSLEFLLLALVASWQTLTYAVAGMTLAVLLGFPLGVIASGAVARSARSGVPVAVGVRLFLAAIRSIHELVWAVLFVTTFGLSSLTVVLALAIPYAGILGRIYSELFTSVPEEPLRALRALRASGASPFRVFLYGRLPMALPDILSYTFYRFECAVRSAAIMSFVGIRGLGYEIQLSLHDLLFNQVWTLMLFMVALVVLVDVWSARVRRSLVT